MKVPDSGMPDEAHWESLFDIPLILDRFSIGPELGNVAEMGCGYGTFTIPVAERISGTVFTCDIEPMWVAPQYPVADYTLSVASTGRQRRRGGTCGPLSVGGDCYRNAGALHRINRASNSRAPRRTNPTSGASRLDDPV